VRRLLIPLALTGLAAAVLVALASASGTTKHVTPSAETANAYLQQGDKPCVNDWMTYGCDIGGTNFSQLKQINKSNVSQLKVAWDQGYSIPQYTGPVQVTPLCCANGLMYVPAANSDLAVNPATGEVVWKYDGAKYDTTSGGPTSTKLQAISRTIAYDPIDNYIFAGQQDSSLVALDAKTGRPVWSVQVAGAGAGTYGTSTGSESEPFAYYVNDGKDGLVLSAPNGGESPMRGSLSAFDAKTGKLVWRTFMTPDPTQLPYILTWANPAEAAVGGAPVWSTPTFDIKDRLVFQGTGNTYPYLGRSPGKNLWANSIMAIHMDTGQLAWYFQTTHHDEWDYDCPHSPNLFNAIVKGKLTPVLADACKNSYLYFFNPTNGHCIFGCAEVANSTLPGYTQAGEALNNAFPTQPRPGGAQGQLIQHCPTLDYVKEQFPSYPTGPDGAPIVLSCDMVAPNASQWLAKPYYISNGVGIGSRASYDPQTNMYYINATASLMIEKNNSPTDYHTTIINSGRVNYTGRVGTLTAVNMNNNTVAWQKWLTADTGNIYSGELTTAGGLLFYSTKGQTSGAGTGRNPDYTALRNSGATVGGQLWAADPATGNILWSFQNPHGDLIESPPITYMYKGTQYIAEFMECPVGTGTQGKYQLCSSHDRLVVLSVK
jgi:outer membrane protein assembly factor BamB